MRLIIKDNSDKSVDKLKQDILNFTENFVKDFGSDVKKTAQKNFDRFIPEVPADDPFVTVYTYNYHSYKGPACEVICKGNQVLFIEFGTGVRNELRHDMKPIEKIGWHGEHLGWIERDIPSHGFKFIDHELVEVAPRPHGIVPLGTYGKGQGSNDYWIYYGYRVSNNSQVFEKKWFRGNTMITRGNQPARALYRAIRSAVNRRVTK